MNGINATREDPSAPLQNLHRMRIRRKVRLLILYNKSKHTEKHLLKKLFLLVSDIKADDVSKMKNSRSSKHLTIALNIK